MVEGTPRWAVVAAYVAVASVLPSAIWRTAIGFGAELGTTEEWRDFQELPGAGTWYVVALSLLSIGAAWLTFGLIRPWGEWVPTGVAVGIATTGALIVLWICVVSVVNWDQVIGFKGKPAPGWYELAVAVYLPALLWGPAVLAATWAYWRRRTEQTVEPVTGFESATSSLQVKREGRQPRS